MEWCAAGVQIMKHEQQKEKEEEEEEHDEEQEVEEEEEEHLDLLECMGLRLSTRCGGWAGDRRFPWGDIHTDQTSSKIR